MHPSILLTVLSAGALTFALPTSTTSLNLTTPENSNSTTHALEKRAHFGWVGSSASDDCSTDYIGGKGQYTRPKIDDDGCWKFNPVSDVIMWKWGGIPYSFDKITFYTDKGCTVGASKKYDGSDMGSQMGCIYNHGYGSFKIVYDVNV